MATRVPGGRAPAAKDPAPAVSFMQAYVELTDWWLERVEGDDGKVRVVGSSTTSRAGRQFTSASIKTRHTNVALETADGVIIRVMSPPNVSKMHQNGFPHKICKYFMLGFPVQWEKYINSNTAVMNEAPQPPLKSTEYYIEKFLRGTLKYSMGYATKGDDLNKCVRNHAEQDADTQQENVHRFSSEQQIATETALIKNRANRMSSGLEDCVTPMCHKTLVQQGTDAALKIKSVGMTPQYGVIQGSEDNTVRRLRNGKVFGMSNGASLKKRVNKRDSTQEKTLRPPGASPRRSVMLSPSFSRKQFRAAAVSAPDEDCDERPCVTLSDWWLEKAEGDGRKIRVAGLTESNQAHLFTSAPIVKRYEACTLETEDGIIVLIDGSLDISQMRENGYSLEVCEKFMIGFPNFWESCNSDIGSQQSSSNISNAREGSTKFYLEKFQLGNIIDSVGSSFITDLLKNAKSYSGGDADAFEECSYLANEIPRFEECACDLDISAKEKAATFYEGSKGSSDLCDKGVNGKMNLIVDSASNEIDNVDSYLNESLASQEFTRDETSKEAVNQNDIIHPNTRDQETDSHPVSSDTIYNRSNDNLPCDREGGNANAGPSVCQGSKEFLATMPPERASRSTETAGCLDNILSSCLEIADRITLNEEVVPHEDMPTSVHSDAEPLKNLVIPAKDQRSEHNATRSPMIRTPSPYVSKGRRPKHDVSLGATRSPMFGTPSQYGHCSPLTRANAKSLSVSTPESLKLKRTRSGRVVVPKLDPGFQRIVYERDGSVSGVASSELQSPLKGRKSQTPARKRKAH